MANWFHCSDTDGSIITGGIAPDDMANLQAAPSGQTLFVVVDGLIGNPYSPTPDFTKLKAYYRAKLDAEVGAVRVQYITDVPGQAQTYEKKEAEARLWAANGGGDEHLNNPSRYPFILAEAQVRQMTFAAVQAEIMVQVDQLTPLAALMEAHRVNAKQNVLNATTLPDIINAAVIPWQSILP